MQVILQIVSGPAVGRKIHLQSGQVAQFGRTEWADFSFPHDATMGDVHFVIECHPAGCRIRDLVGGGRTQIDGQPVDEANIASGSRITAGSTVFLVQLEEARGTWTAPQPLRIPTRSVAAVDGAAAAVAASSPSAAEICRRYELEDDAKQHLSDNQTPEEFVQKLVAAGLLRDALRFQAHRLPKRESVWWACCCVRLGGGDQLSPGDRVAVDAAEQWVREPGEESARAAEEAAETLKYQTAASWAAAAAFWSGDSLAPPDVQPVPPPPHLTGTAVAAALTLAGLGREPQAAPRNYQQFLDLAGQIVRGEGLWPQS